MLLGREIPSSVMEEGSNITSEASIDSTDPYSLSKVDSSKRVGSVGHASSRDLTEGKGDDTKALDDDSNDDDDHDSGDDAGSVDVDDDDDDALERQLRNEDRQLVPIGDGDGTSGPPVTGRSTAIGVVHRTVPPDGTAPSARGHDGDGHDGDADDGDNAGGVDAVHSSISRLSRRTGATSRRYSVGAYTDTAGVRPLCYLLLWLRRCDPLVSRGWQVLLVSHRTAIADSGGCVWCSV